MRQLSRDVVPQGFNEDITLSYVPVDIVSVVKVVRQRCVNLGQSKVILRRNFVRGLTHPLMPHGNVMHRDSVPRDAWFPPAMPGVISICWSSVFVAMCLPPFFANPATFQLARSSLGRVVASSHVFPSTSIANYQPAMLIILAHDMASAQPKRFYTECGIM